MVLQRLWRPLICGVGKRIIIGGQLTTKSRFFCIDSPAPAQYNNLEEFLAKHEITIQGKKAESVRPIFNFDEANFSEPVIRALKSKFETPSVIQSASWPAVLEGRDLVGVARTGSGKTLAFLLPALVHISNQDALKRGDGPIVLVLCPTRELAQQVQAVAQEWSKVVARVRTMCAFGGASRGPQEQRLMAGVEIVVATPGRLNDFLRSRSTNMSRCSYLVLDEADRMLDMGFEPQIRQIISQIETDRQTLMFSATWPNEVRQLASDFMKDYVYVKIGSAELAANKNITQIVHVTTKYERDNEFWNLLSELKQRDPKGKMLVFSLQKRVADRLSFGAVSRGLSADAIHGDKSQATRDRVLSRFRTGHIQVLFATDVAARGLDVDDIKYVVNYDHPFCIEDYVHRIGRTARREQKGESHTFLTEEDAGSNAKDLVKVLEASDQPVPEKLCQLTLAHNMSSKASRRRWGSSGKLQDGFWDHNNSRRDQFAPRDRRHSTDRYDRYDRYRSADGAGGFRDYSSSDRYTNVGSNRRRPPSYDRDDLFDVPYDDEDSGSGRRALKK